MWRGDVSWEGGNEDKAHIGGEGANRTKRWTGRSTQGEVVRKGVVTYKLSGRGKPLKGSRGKQREVSESLSSPRSESNVVAAGPGD